MDLNQITRVTTHSWGSRLKESIGGVAFGAILLLVSFPLLFWNESRAVQRARTLTEGAGAVISVDAEQVDAANEGRLVHLSGRAVPRGTLSDPEFGVSADAIGLRRDVEMYQWREKTESDERKKLGGGTETVTTYTYERTWSGRLIDSNEFEQPAGHENPTQRPYAPWEASATEVFVGAFQLSDSLIGDIGGSAPLPVTSDMLPEALRGRATVSGRGFYVGTDPAAPQIGDVRIRFEQVPATEVSVVARQTGSRLEPFPASTGGSIELLEQGLHAADAMFASAQTENTVLTWVLRVAGFVIMWLGISMIFRPFVVLADVVPMLGNLVGAGVGLITFLLAAVLSLLTIAVAWIFARPLLGVALLAAAAILGFLIVRRMQGRRVAATG